jgi:hypothetical protein
MQVAPASNGIVATWSSAGTVNIFDMSAHARLLDDVSRRVSPRWREKHATAASFY